MDKREYLLNVVLFRMNKVTKESLIEGVEPDSEESETSNVFVELVKGLYEKDYVLSQEVYDTLKGLSQDELVIASNKLERMISMVKGDTDGEVFYHDFPTTVSQMSDEDLDYYRSMNYLYRGLRLVSGNPQFDYVPSRFLNFGEEDKVSEKELELFNTIKEGIEDYSKFLENNKEKTVITFGTEDEAIGYIRNIIDAKSSISEDMREILNIILEFGDEDISKILPEEITRKEIMANVVSLLVQKEEGKIEPFKKYINTTTDVLRVLDVLNGGDGTLKTFTYNKMSRSTRRFVLNLLDDLNPYIVSEDMFRNSGVWKGLLQVIHPFEKRFNKYKNAQKSFKLFVEGDKSHTFSHKIEKEITELKETGNVSKVLDILTTRPGEFARKLDLVLRETKEGNTNKVLQEFQNVVPDVSAIILYQMKSHFDNYQSDVSLIETTNGFFVRKHQRGISDFDLYIVRGILGNELKSRLSELESLGKVYLDPRLKMLKMPVSLRTASVNSSRLLTRGSRIPMGNKENVRLFTHWKNIVDNNNEVSTDVDLSVMLIGENNNVIDRIAYYSQRSPKFGSLVFSGDMTNASGNGANEFIDFNKQELKDKGVKRVVMSVIVYHTHLGMKTFKEIESTAGWVEFNDYDSNLKKIDNNPWGSEHVQFNTSEVKNQFDLVSQSTSTIPLYFDLERDEVVWTDVFAPTKNGYGTVDSSVEFISNILKGYDNDNTISLYELLDMHIKYRNSTEVFEKENADIVFDLDTINIPEILSEYM